MSRSPAGLGAELLSPCPSFFDLLGFWCWFLWWLPLLHNRLNDVRCLNLFERFAFLADRVNHRVYAAACESKSAQEFEAVSDWQPVRDHAETDVPRFFDLIACQSVFDVRDVRVEPRPEIARKIGHVPRAVGVTPSGIQTFVNRGETQRGFVIPHRLTCFF